MLLYPQSRPLNCLPDAAAHLVEGLEAELPLLRVLLLLLPGHARLEVGQGGEGLGEGDVLSSGFLTMGRVVVVVVVVPVVVVTMEEKSGSDDGSGKY